MDYFDYRDSCLHAEEVPLPDIAEAVGTPCYIYSRRTIERHWRAFDDAFEDYPHDIFYAVKANSNLAVLNLLARLGSGFDIVSGGELERVIAAGGDPSRIVFSGVCKLDWEIERALSAGISSFNIESDGELERISRAAARLGKVARIAVRINPDVDARTHPYISTGLRDNKFGLNPQKALEVYRTAAADPHIEVHGIACHIGSQLTDMGPYQDALSRILSFVEKLAQEGIAIGQIDFGGGLGVRYSDEEPPSPRDYWLGLLDRLRDRETPIPVAIEPGRAIMANAGVLLTRVCYLKQGDSSRFCIVDAGMNDLIRPALYQAYQEIVPVRQRPELPEHNWDVVGPVCESSDFLGKDRPLAVEENDLVAVRSAGAYCAVMSSNYNARPRAAEVLVDGDRFHLVRARESLEALYAGESVLPD